MVSVNETLGILYSKVFLKPPKCVFSSQNVLHLKKEKKETCR